MPARVYKTDKEQLLAEGKLIVSSTDDAKFQPIISTPGISTQYEKNINISRFLQ